MKIIGEKLSNRELLMVKGGCDIDCYCESVWLLLCDDISNQPIWEAHNCPKGNPGDPGYPGSGGSYMGGCDPIVQ